MMAIRQLTTKMAMELVRKLTFANNESHCHFFFSITEPLHLHFVESYRKLGESLDEDNIEHMKVWYRRIS